MSLTNDQFFLLGKLCSYVTDNRRTDKLAQFLSTNPEHLGGGKKWTTSHVPFIGLQLRDLGLVTTYKDNSQYARWDVTPAGKAAFVEQNNRPKLPDPKLAAPVTVGVPPVRGYIVVSANDSGEQSDIKINKVEADNLAKKWATEDPGAVYLVCAVLDKVKATIVVTKE